MSTRRSPARLPAWLVIAVSLVAVATVAVLALSVARGTAADGSAASRTLDLAVTFELVTAGLDSPVALVGPGDGSGDRYVVEKAGRVARLQPDGTLASEPLLDISDRVLDHHERGLLGLAFHPAFADNGRFYLAYSLDGSGATVVSEFTLPGEPEPPEEGEEPEEPTPVERTEKHLLVLPQPFTTHKGGMLDFDRDGMLLISTGDGGSAYDPFDHALDPSSLLGKMLRLDVDRGWPYGIPADNGFADVPGARGEVHAIGLRNPWRFSVDPASGDLYIADVGQKEWEEVNVLRRGASEVSFGWSDLEGDACLTEEACGADEHTGPAVVYGHEDGDTGHCGIIGGHVFRGGSGSLPDGTYLYADYCSGAVWAVPAEQLVDRSAAPTIVARHDPTAGQIQAFGRDDDGELYALTSAGEVLWVRAGDTPAAVAADDAAAIAAG